MSDRRRPGAPGASRRLVDPLRGLHRRRAWPRVPAIATAPVLGWSTGILYMVCGLLVAGSVRWVPSGHHLHSIELLGVVAVGFGALVLLLHRRMPRWTFHLTELTGIIAVAAGLQLVGDGTAAASYAFLMVLLVVEAYFFFSWPAASLHTLAAMGAVVVVVGRSPGINGADIAVITGSLSVTAGIVGWLVHATATAEVDVLTGLPNRRGTQRELESALARAERTGGALAVALVDLDHFKVLNDTRGHAAGDRLLRTVARAWTGHLPAGALLGRWGGDEFLLVLPGADGASAAELVDALRGDLPVEHSCSAGTSEVEPGDSASLLLGRADSALYQAKRMHRGTTRQHASAQADGRALLAALDAGHIEVHYQPVVGLADGVARGAEALVRWRHPARGLLAPDGFLPAAELSGTIVELGRWVLTRACADAAQWARLPDGTRRRVNVNASGAELAAPGYLDAVADALHAAALPPDALVLEITEGLIDLDAPEVADALGGLAALGVRLAVDDFGTGYSSLTRLARLDAAVLKIDRSFVTPIPSSPEGTRLVTGVLGLAATLGLDVVAEGVETAAQEAWLRRAGCPKVQGYLYSPALPAAEFSAWLAEGDRTAPAPGAPRR